MGMDADAKTRDAALASLENRLVGLIAKIVSEEREACAKIVSEEREACAKIADEVGDDDDVWEATRIAKLIRARK